MQGRLNGVTVAVWSRDPAFDTKAPGFADKLKTLREGGDVAMSTKEGRQPVKWRLVSLSERAYIELSRVAFFEALSRASREGDWSLMDQASYPLRRDALRRGLVGADGVVDDKGQPLKLEHEETPSGKVLTTASMEALYQHYGPRCIAELGQRVIDLSELDPP